MHELDDNALLREYVEHDSGEAFAALTTRHVNKVYSVALRQTNNPHSAEEITQVVFVILARRARGLLKHKSISGWLYETARLTSVTFIRSEIRRARREQEAHMQNLLNESESDAWTQIAPLLDTAMAWLNEADRHAVVLRFFDGKTMREVGAALGANEDAAKKRVNRAVEKLRAFFTKRGVIVPATILTSAIAANSVQAAPVALAKTVSVVAVAKGATASTSTLTLMKGALKVMAWTKVKTAVVVCAGLLLTAGMTTYVATTLSHESQDDAIAAIKKLGGDVRFRQNKTPYLVSLDSTRATDADLVHLKALPTIQTLSLSYSNVTGASFNYLKSLTNLTSLYLWKSKVDDTGLKQLENVPMLVNLYLSGTRVTDAGLAHLKGLTHLRTLYLDSTKVSDAGLKHLEGLRLPTISLNDTAVTDAGFESLTQLQLVDLHLSRTAVTDAGLEHLKELTNLSTLDLAGTKVTDAGLINLEGLTTLKELRLDQTAITDAGLEHLKGLTRLKDLNLTKTKVTPTGVRNLELALPGCRITH